MVLFGGAAAAQRITREKLRLTEQSLLRFAKRYGGRTPETYRIKTVDTTIPASSVSLQGLKDDDELIIHEIRVDALEKNEETLSRYPLVIVHGYGNSSLNFYRNLIGLSKYFDTIMSLDLLGWGLSSRPAFKLQNDSVEGAEDVFVESLEEWRKAQEVDKLVLAGHSMGGYLSAAYCERYPERVDRLVLLSPVGVIEETSRKPPSSMSFSIMSSIWHTLYHWDWTPGAIMRILPAERGRSMVTGYVEKRLPAITELDEREAFADYLFYNNSLSGSGEYAFRKLLKPNAFAFQPLVHRIPKLKGVSHVSFIYGSDDWMDANGGLQVENACLNSSTAPTVSVYQVPEAGHLLMLDNWVSFETSMVLAMGGTPSLQDVKKLIPEDMQKEKVMTIQT